jgi:hypothetical protein
MAGNKPRPKSQEELRRDTIKNYVNPESGVPVNQKAGPTDLKNRAKQISRKEDNVKNLTVGIKDIDEAIYYYFNEVLQPTVTQNAKSIKVPLVYGSPERWAAMQKDGYYRDKNGKMQAPLIVFRRDSIEKNRQLGNKLDGNNPTNFGVFKKKFSKKNIYDRFGVLNNRQPVEEYYAVAIPDYVNIAYSCIIFTDYVEQNNKIIEGVNFASDSYWGDPEKFRFRAQIDNYTTSAEIVQGNDRIIKTNFTINLLGHIITDAINAHPHQNKKFYTKAEVKFGSEIEGNL